MTPEPEPEPTYTLTVRNTFSNSYMFRVLAFTGSAYTAIAGGVSTITDPAVIGFSFDDSVTITDRFRIAYKAYDNSHTEWNDSYYDDSVVGNFSSSSEGTDVSNVLLLDDTVFVVSFNSTQGSQFSMVSRS